MDGEPIAGRECGACNVCCVALTINDPALQKPQGYRCRNALPDHSCAIYPDRPHTCREFNCGWRLLKWVKESLRPDRSGVLIKLHGEVLPTGEKRLGISVTLLRPAALKADGLAETLAAAVAAGRPVFLIIPGPPGYTAAQARLNLALDGPVLARDKPAMLAVLRRAWREGQKGTRHPIVLTPPSAPPQTGSG